jgi:hypothetical protein
LLSFNRSISHESSFELRTTVGAVLGVKAFAEAGSKREDIGLGCGRE